MPSSRQRKRRVPPRRQLPGPARNPTQASIYRFVRYMNVSNATGTSVDGVVLQKSSTNLLLTTGATANSLSYGTMSFYVSLSDTPDYTDFTNLFDQYRIDSVEVKLYPYCTSATTGAAYSSSSGQTGVIVHAAVDYDDSALPTGTDAGIQKLREYQNYSANNLYAKHGGSLDTKWVPRIAMPVYQGTFSAYASRPFDWIDCATPDAQGYGYKAIFEVVSSGIAVGVLVKAEAKVHLSFRNVR